MMLHDRQYDPAIPKHVDADAARRRGSDVVVWVTTHFFDRKYAPARRHLTMQWLPNWTFNAYAGRLSNDTTHDIIDLLDGIPIALHDDAETFLRWVEKEIVHPPRLVNKPLGIRK